MNKKTLPVRPSARIPLDGSSVLSTLKSGITPTQALISRTTEQVAKVLEWIGNPMLERATELVRIDHPVLNKSDEFALKQAQGLVLVATATSEILKQTVSGSFAPAGTGPKFIESVAGHAARVMEQISARPGWMHDKMRGDLTRSRTGRRPTPSA